MENRLRFFYTTSLINFQYKTQVFDAVLKSTVNLAFNRLKQKQKNRKLNQVQIMRLNEKRQECANQKNIIMLNELLYETK